MHLRAGISVAKPAALCCAILTGALGGIGDASAERWRMTPRVTASETWSDNISLRNTNTESDFVTRITPGVAIVGEGGRISLNLDYQLGLVHYASGTSSNRIDHRLQLVSTTELVSQRLFLDFDSSAGQNNIASTGLLSSDNVSANANRRNFFTYDISPYVVHHFGPYADGQLRVRHARVLNSGSINTSVNELSGRIDSGRRFAFLPWSLSADWTRNSNSNGTSSEFRSVDGSVRYSFSRRYALRFNLGYEDNEQVRVSDEDNSGVTWQLTGIWTPSARTSLEFGYGRRAFGPIFHLDASHRTRRTVFQASYSEDITTTATRQLERQLVTLEDLFGEAIVDPGLADVEVPIDTPTITDETLITQRFDASMALRQRRTTSSLSAYYETRSFEITPNDENVFGVTARVFHSLNSTISATATANWQRTEFDALSREDDQWRVELSLSRQFNADVSGTLRVQHRENDSTVSNNSYKENRVDARVSVLF